MVGENNNKSVPVSDNQVVYEKDRLLNTGQTSSFASHLKHAGNSSPPNAVPLGPMLDAHTGLMR